MGRPLNSRFFGKGEGKLIIDFFNGTETVEGYIIKQLGTTKYRVTEDGINFFDVNLVKTIEEADDMREGQGAFIVKNSKGEREVLTRVWSATATTSSGEAVSWVGDDADIHIDVQEEAPTDPSYGYWANETLCPEAMKNDTDVYFGSGNRAENYNLFRNHQIEFGLKVFKFRGSGKDDKVSTYEGNGEFKTVIPNKGWVADSRVDWSLGFSIVALESGGKSLDDFDLSLTIGKKGGRKVTLRPGPCGFWSADGTYYMAIDQGVAPEVVDGCRIDQNSFNLGWNSFAHLFDPVDGDEKGWALLDGEYEFSLKVGRVGEVKLTVVTDSSEEW